MSISLIRANRILEKLQCPPIRAANHFEHQYGKWVIDQGEFQQFRGFETIHEAIAHIIECHWGEISGQLNTLTEQEQQELRALPSRVSNSI